MELKPKSLKIFNTRLHLTTVMDMLFKTPTPTMTLAMKRPGMETIPRANTTFFYLTDADRYKQSIELLSYPTY